MKLSTNKQDNSSNERKATFNLFKYHPKSKSFEEKDTRFLRMQ